MYPDHIPLKPPLCEAVAQKKLTVNLYKHKTDLHMNQTGFIFLL